MTRSKTFVATPPGATIKEQLVDRGMSQKEFAARMDMSEKHISNLINGEVQLTPDVAMRLEMVLGLPASFWNNLESIYREKLQKVREENEMDDDIVYSKNFPYNEMSNYDWVEKTKNKVEQVYNLRKFFEIARLGLLKEPSVQGIAFRRLGEGNKSDFALMVWAQKAKLEARKIETENINLVKLKKSLPEIRKMTRQSPSEFCPVMGNLFASCGIALVFLPHIGGSFLHGATFYDGNKIVLGMTVRGKDADRFWFSLFHEIGHILLGHISGCSEPTKEDEAEADRFARDTLINQEAFDNFIDVRNFSQLAIKRFADRIEIDPGIVVGRLQKEGYIPYNRCCNLKTKYELSA